MKPPLAIRIEERLEKLGLSARAASLQAGASADLIRNIQNGRTKYPSPIRLRALARVLETTPEWLLGDTPENFPKTTSQTNDQNTLNTDRRDIPILGTAAGSALGAFQFNENPIGFVGRPSSLADARGIYALYIIGHSMEPEHRPGDLRIIHPHKPPRIGDSIIVQTRNHENEPIVAMIGHFKKRTEKSIIVEKLNPQHDVEIDLSTIHQIHKVLTTQEIFGA